MAEDLKEAKKKVVEEWQNAFPQLTLYSQNKLYKIIGPIVTGIELMKLPRTEEYRPHFVIYPLWKNNAKECLDVPIILKEYYNRKGLQFSIPYEKHSIYFEEVLGSVKKETPISLAGDVSLKKLFDVIDEYSKMPPLNASPNSYLQAKLQETKLEIALCISSNSEVRNVLAQIQKRKWDIVHFAMWNIDFNEWLQGLKEKVNYSNDFFNRIAVNKQDKKLEKLQQSELKA